MSVKGAPHFKMDRHTKREMGVKRIENTVVDDVLDWCDSFVFAMFIIILIFMFVVRQVVVDGRSMYPTLNDGDRIIINHMFSDPKQGDIVVLNSEVLGKTLIKRVIAVGGQDVEIDYASNEVFVDGKKLDESYLKGSALDMKVLIDFDNSYYDESSSTYKYTVPDDCVFVMGDNRNNSTDSRAIGCVPVDCILGKATIRLFPFSKFGAIED